MIDLPPIPYDGLCRRNIVVTAVSTEVTTGELRYQIAYGPHDFKQINTAITYYDDHLMRCRYCLISGAELSKHEKKTE